MNKISIAGNTGFSIALNKAQEKAVFHNEGPLLIAAGAGSGKTKTLTARLVHLLEKRGVAPGNIVAITFTNKAAREMASRLQGRENLPFIGTFHSFGAGILRKQCRLAGRTPSFSIFDEEDSRKTVKEAMARCGLKQGRFYPAAIRSKISYFKNELTDLKEYLPINDLEKAAIPVFEEYEALLKKNNAFDFDDLIEKAVFVFKKHPLILKQYQDRYQYILIDEYQDVNTSQYQLVKLLAGKNRNVNAVGDDFQSVYKFRGADFRNFVNFEKDWPKAKVILLEQNYRSTANIIKAASALISHNKFQKPKKLWTENPEGNLIKVIETEDPEEEAEWVVSSVIAHDSASQTAVLYRTNAQSRALEQSLISRNMPYEIYGGVKFYERKEIKDIVAGLRFGLNPRDSLSAERIEKSFRKAVGRTITADLPVLAAERPILDLISFLIKKSDYLNFLKSRYQNFEERIENIQELISFASRFQEMKPPSGLATFLEQASLMQQSDSVRTSLPSKKAIRLMTIHLAKGLEFENVYVVGCGEGILPHQKSLAIGEELEEERRLMYVAMTRAKKNLFLAFYGIPSRFLYEIPPELTEFSGEKALDDEERYITLD